MIKLLKGYAFGMGIFSFVMGVEGIFFSFFGTYSNKLIWSMIILAIQYIFAIIAGFIFYGIISVYFDSPVNLWNSGS